MKKRVKEYVETRADVLHKRMPSFWASQHTANLTSKAIAYTLCCPKTDTKCFNNWLGTRSRANITKDLPYKSASWKIAKAKANRKCMCITNNNYERPIFGNRPGGCGSGYIL